MILNDATLLSKNIDGVECSTMREFISKLVKAKDLSMKVYVNSKLVCSGSACLNIDNNWIIASTNVLLSYTNAITTESIVVKIMQGDVELFESVTPCNVIIPAKDTVATFYVCLGNSTPYNELAKRVPESRFTPIPVNRIPDTSWADIKSTLNDGADVTIDDPDDGDTGGIDVEPTKVQVTIDTSAVSGAIEDGGEITEAYIYNASSSEWLPCKWSATFECIANGSNFIRVGVYNSMKQVSVAPADGVENIKVYFADDDTITNQIKDSDGAVEVYQIEFIPTNDSTLIVNVSDVTEDP